MNKVYIVVALSILACNEEKTSNLKFKYPELKYLDHRFKYMTEDYKINIDATTFDNTLKLIPSISNKSLSYKDSLLRILTLELKDPQEVSKAFNVFAYSWTRLSYHLWLTVEETKNMANKYNINHPLEFKYYLLEENGNKEILEFKNNLKRRIIESTNDTTVLELNNNELFDFALLNSKERIEAEMITNFKKSLMKNNEEPSDAICQDFLNSIKDENGKIKKKGCGKIDCCMLACK
jgi:hypothetical protein